MKLAEENYIERDVSWMLFNRRILAEAQRQEIPLMERLNFLGIYSNNLDEFFRVRVATLNRIVDFADKNSKDLRERSKQALKTIGRLNAKYAQTFKETVKDVFNQLQKKHIHLLSEQELDDSQKEAVKEYCLSKLAGNLFFGPGSQFPVRRLHPLYRPPQKAGQAEEGAPQGLCHYRDSRQEVRPFRATARCQFR